MTGGRQRTIGRAGSISGVGLHTGVATTLTFRPAPPDWGVRFFRVDLPDSPQIPVTVACTASAQRRTTLERGGVELHTVEHVLAAVAGLGIDNLAIEVDANEVPEVDGSALPFVRLLKECGIVEQERPRSVYRLRQPTCVGDASAGIMAFPCDGLELSYTLDYGHPILRRSTVSVRLDPETFEREVAGARTFCLKEEADALRAQGLGKGATLENTIVVTRDGVLNEGPLRFPDEFARHKLLDLVADLSLLGMALEARIVANRSGHALNRELVGRIADMRETEAERVRDAEPILDIVEIRRILPHRYPFLLVDRIVEIEEDRRIVGIKNVTANEEFFNGHFPDRPIMPGVLITEAMAQTAGVLLMRKPENRGMLAYIAGVDGLKFRRPVVPGDTLVMEAEVVRLKERFGKMRTRALVRGAVVAEAEMTFSLVPAEERGEPGGGSTEGADAEGPSDGDR